MSDPIFDLDSWEPLFRINENMVVDPKGKFYTRMNENMVMDLDTGKVRFITPWKQGEDERGD